MCVELCVKAHPVKVGTGKRCGNGILSIVRIEFYRVTDGLLDLLSGLRRGADHEVSECPNPLISADIHYFLGLVQVYILPLDLLDPAGSGLDSKVNSIASCPGKQFDQILINAVNT